ncbi:MAG: hypothetical protein J7M38_08760 [Armatimonadetes bacterium]|nr:hypothetical protein [Armatimonadota bacterium]
MPTRILIALLAASAASLADASVTDIFFNSDPEAMTFGGSRVPAALTDTPRTDFPTSLRWCNGGAVSAETIIDAPLRMKRGGRQTGHFDTSSTTIRFATPVVQRDGRGWFVGWRSRFMDNTVHWGDPGEELDIDGRSYESSIGLAWALGDGWTIGASAADYGLRLDGSGPRLDDWQRLGDGGGWAKFDFDATTWTLAVERRRRSHIWGVQYSRRPVDAMLQLPKEDDLYIGAYDGTQAVWDAWYARQCGQRRWFAWAAASSMDSGQDPLAAYPQLRGRIHTSFDAMTIGIGARKRSANTTSQLDLSYQRHDLNVDGWLDQGLMSGGLTGRYIADVWVDADTFALRCGRREYYGPWRTEYGLGATYSKFDAYYHYIDTPGPFQHPDTEWKKRADGATLWTMALTAGGGYRTRDWELAAHFTILGAVMNADFVDLMSKRSAPRTSSKRPSSKLKPGYTMGVTWTWNL